MKRKKRNRKILRDARGRFKKRAKIRRDARGRFKKSPRKRVRFTKKQLAERARKHLARGGRAFNLCSQREREAFYNRIIDDRVELRATGKITEEESSRLVVVIDIIGEPKRRNKKKKRRSTRFIGERRFGNLTNLKKFLLLDAGRVSGSPASENGVNWDKNHLCQFEKKARLVVKPAYARRKERVLKRYRLGE